MKIKENYTNSKSWKKIKIKESCINIWMIAEINFIAKNSQNSMKSFQFVMKNINSHNNIKKK
jgi:hypothetical protein